MNGDKLRECLGNSDLAEPVTRHLPARRFEFLDFDVV
jgi:hypothetical protein